MEQVAPLAPRGEVGVRVVSRVMVAVCSGQVHSSGPHDPQHIIIAGGRARTASSSISPCAGVRIPPAAIAKMIDHASMRPAAALAPTLRPVEPDHGRQLRPVDGVKETVLAPDRHRRTMTRGWAGSHARQLVIAPHAGETPQRHRAARVRSMTLPAAQALGLMACAVAASAAFLWSLVLGITREKSGAMSHEMQGQPTGRRMV